MDFCDILRTLIEEKNLTQKRVANDLHIPVSTMGAMYKGPANPILLP